MTYKKCIKCSMIKELECFYRHSRMADGHLNKCKDCTIIDTVNNYYKNIEYYREYDKKRQLDPKRIKNKKIYSKKFYILHPEKVKEYHEKWKGLNKEKRIAHNLIWAHVKDRPNKCELCDKNVKKIYAHHYDYSKPLDVIWLCSACHADVHWRGKEINLYKRA